ncbi:transporter substrate-binding domain-containing protein [Shewanella waksmanii]|uniref:transporter substrate-binding domain-containing protein n=1 Tax=Shewanella waksmanii TaxID=213783 RepID=UPI00048B2F15|nr:transporter substrate-binding domain-containing protein [Shewanella waksmanii]
MKLAVYVKLIVCLTALSVATSLRAQQPEALPMVILLEAGEFDIADDEEPHLLNKMWGLIRQSTSQPLAVEQLQVSMSRSWKELPKQQNACIMNALKSDERQQIAHFSRYPLSVYPPIRLFHRADSQMTFDKPFDFDVLSDRPEITLGTVKGRSYGSLLNQKLAEHQLNVYQRSSIESSTKLIEMLMANRVDAILDYSLSIDHFFQVMQTENPLVALPIVDASEPMFGYIACSKTPAGKQLIAAIDASMSQEAVQQQYIDLHRQFFGETEYQLLQSTLAQLFAPQ